MTDRDYTDNQVKWMKEFMETELRSVREAVNKVENTYATYREQQNEWRGQSKDQASGFATKQDIAALNKFMYMMVGALLVINFIGLGGLLLIINYGK
jgi:hypothetical protein